MMMQSCRHGGETLVSAVRMIFNHIHYQETEGLVLSDTTVHSQYASTRDRHLIASGDKTAWRTPRPKRIVSA